MTMPGSFVLQRSSNQQYYFNLRAGNNKIILTSETYPSKAAAQKGIQAVKTNARLEARYSRKGSGDSQPYFVLRAANGEPLGTSELYASNTARENGIKAVKQNAPKAATVDRT
jgi:hypothetical protein